LWYDDYTAGGPNPVTPNLINVLGYTTGVEHNDTTFQAVFPFVQTPWSGFGKCGGTPSSSGNGTTGIGSLSLGIGAPVAAMVQNYPNPFKDQTTFKFRTTQDGLVDISIYDLTGRKVANVMNQQKSTGTYEVNFNASALSTGVYIATLSGTAGIVQSMRINVVK
jgi:hypothetical protein